jgi:hypothetical protein
MIEPDLLYSVLCDDVRREDNGKLMLLGLFEKIAAAEFPAQHGRCCIVNKWCNGTGRWTQQTRFVDEDDVVLLQGEASTFELAGMEANFTAVHVFSNLTIYRPGRVFVEVLLDGELKQRYALHIMSTHAPMGDHDALQHDRLEMRPEENLDE